MRILRTARFQWRRALVLGLLSTAGATLLRFGDASAGELPHLGLRAAWRTLAEPTIPPEWAGIWNTVDSTFSCTGTFMDTSSGVDTLCTGDPAGGDPEGPVTEISCTGSVDATSADITCTGTADFSGCLATLNNHITATRSGNTYVVHSETTITYSGPSFCSLIPPFCQRVTTHGTRVAGEPQNCSVAVGAIPWGEMKRLYRD